MVYKIPLEWIGRIFPTYLITLEGKGIDIILVMRWTKMHKALLDIFARLVDLNSLVNGKVTLHPPVVAHLQAAVHTRSLCNHLLLLISKLLFTPLLQRAWERYP
jgi:hypothetical protein